MTLVDRIEARTSHLEAGAHHAERLVQALGDPSEWRYTGTCIDAGPDALRSINPPRCACEHPIRYIFIIEHPTKGQTQVGSVCIEHLGSYTPELAAELRAAAEALQQRLRDARAAARRAAQQEEVDRARAAFEAARDRAVEEYRRYRARGERAPSRLWEAVASRYYRLPQEAPQYVRPSDYLRFYRRYAVEWASVTEGE